MTSVIVLFVICIGSCKMHNDTKYNYPENLTISDQKGMPKDTDILYFPPNINKDTFIRSGIDTILYHLYSCCLRVAREPVLYNFYIGHDIYRFLWLRSFHRPVVLSIHKNSDSIWIETKILDKHPISKYEIVEVNSSGNVLPLSEEEARQAKIVVNKKKTLSIKEWEKFETLLQDCDFWKLSTPKSDKVLVHVDGSNWIIEGQLKNNYWLVNRRSPKDNYRKCGEYLITLSGLNEKIY